MADETPTDATEQAPQGDPDDVQIVIRYNRRTSALRCEGQIPQPVMFYGILEAAKEWMRYQIVQQARAQAEHAQMRATIMGGGKALPPEFRQRR